MLNNNLLLADDGYNIQRSLRFRASASAYLSRTPASAGNRQVWTWSGWVKYSVSDNGVFNAPLFHANTGSDGSGIMFEQSPNTPHRLFVYNAGANINTSQLFRDPSAWYHIVAAIDNTQATSSNRTKLYVNGQQVTSFASATYPAQNANGAINAITEHDIGRQVGLSRYFDGYLTDVHFIDGQALTPSSFGETDSQTGVWKPKKYAGTYGTNGFFLNFSDNSAATAAAIGKDSSGNGNNWTPNNISVTAGSTYDSMTDVPTLTSATAANYCVINPVGSNSLLTISNANLRVTNSNNSSPRAVGSMYVRSGKWYFETVFTTPGDYSSVGFGQSASISLEPGQDALSYAYFLDAGSKYTNSTQTTYGAGLTTNDVFMCALDLDNLKIYFGKNGTWFASSDPTTGANPAFTISSGEYTPITRPYKTSGSAVLDFNFGQRPFAYTPPTGFVALNTFNLPDSTIKAGNKHFDATLYTGNGSARSITNAGSFPAEFVWLKDRSTAYNHQLYDIVRGALNYLPSSGTDAEAQVSGGGVTAFNSNGFSLGTNSGINTNGDAYVAWQWKANGSAVSNTAGSITSQVSANPSAGFSVVTYTGTGTLGTIGHGLGIAPSMIIVKGRSRVSDWDVYHKSLGNGQYISLNLTNAAASSAWLNNTSPTSSVFTVNGGTYGANFSGATTVAYCFSEVAGYSKFGSYTGNGSADGPFVHLGFRPKFLMVKCSSSVQDWKLIDTARNTYNSSNSLLGANVSSAEDTNSAYDFDILSNGFKPRNTFGYANSSGANYIYMAFAENPFKYSLAR